MSIRSAIRPAALVGVAGLALAVLAGGPAHAADDDAAMRPAAVAGAVEVHAPWARASAGPARNGGAFMTFRNTGETDAAVVAASSAVAEKVELHAHVKDGEVMRMREVPRIDVPAGETVRLRPGGLHVMLMGLTAPLKTGESFDLTLTLEDGATATVSVPVKGVAAMGAAEPGH